MQTKNVPDRRREPRHSVQGHCWFDLDGVLHSGLLIDVSAAGGYVCSQLRPAIGSRTMLAHPSGGAVAAQIARHGADGFGIAFELGEASVTFALRAIAGAMTVAA